MADWKTPTIVLVMVILVLLSMFNMENKNHSFEINSDTLKYHANWTSKI